MNIVYNMDCLEAMRRMPDKCIDLTVTSPPYDDLRTYNGYKFDWKATISELHRITKDGGVVVWIVADQTKGGSETGTSFRQALWAKECGFNLHDTMIWAKDGGGAIGSHYTYTQNFEYMFVFSKGKIKTANIIYDKPNLSFGTKKKQGNAVGRRKQNGEIKRERRKEPKEFSSRNNWWYVVPQPQKDANWHPAVFPMPLIRDHIRTWSNEGDTVLDPFLGSGTTRIAAYDLNRNFVGFEIDKDYYDKQEERFEAYTSQMSLYQMGV